MTPHNKIAKSPDTVLRRQNWPPLDRYLTYTQGRYGRLDLRRSSLPKGKGAGCIDLIGAIPSPAAATIAPTVRGPRSIPTSSPPAVEATTTSETTSSTTATTRHARQVGPFGDHLDVPALEDTLVEHKGLCNQAGLGKFDVGISESSPHVSVAQRPTYILLAPTHPLGWPVNLSSRIVTRFIEPQLWKCAWISSGEAE